MIEIKNLTKAYGDQIVLEQVNFRFPETGLICLLGASGCGKSTLLNLIAGFDSDYSGEITVCGTSISSMSTEELCEYRGNNIGFIFQDYHLLKGYTVLENSMIACEHGRLDRDNDKMTAKSLLAQLGIANKENEKVENLSGGQKQRTAIARALMGAPRILLADEPTGALDRKTSTEIMGILKELSEKCLVLVITHDPKVCEHADQVISIKNGKITGRETSANLNWKQECIMGAAKRQKGTFGRGLKNFKVHLGRYIAIAAAIAMGAFSLILSLSSGNIMEESIAQFKEKNHAYNNGYVKLEEDKNVYALLKADIRTENVYYQYKVHDISLDFDGKMESMAEKYPMPKASESMSFGGMPQTGKSEIALSPSLAKKFNTNISNLVGKDLRLRYQGQDYKLKISGIFNAGYDDFFVSSDIEQVIYKGLLESDAYSVSYDVKNFEDITGVNNMLQEKGIDSIDASKEAAALQNTFNNLSSLFFTVTVLIAGIGLFTSTILIVKHQNSRFREIGLYSALGFQRRAIRSIIITENILLSAMAALFNAALVGAAYLAAVFLKLSISVSISQMLFSMAGTGAAVILISMLASYRLLRTEPAIALRK